MKIHEPNILNCKQNAMSQFRKLTKKKALNCLKKKKRGETSKFAPKEKSRSTKVLRGSIKSFINIEAKTVNIDLGIFVFIY